MCKISCNDLFFQWVASKRRLVPAWFSAGAGLKVSIYISHLADLVRHGPAAPRDMLLQGPGNSIIAEALGCFEILEG